MKKIISVLALIITAAPAAVFAKTYYSGSNSDMPVNIKVEVETTEDGESEVHIKDLVTGTTYYKTEIESSVSTSGGEVDGKIEIKGTGITPVNIDVGEILKSVQSGLPTGLPENFEIELESGEGTTTVTKIELLNRAGIKIEIESEDDSEDKDEDSDKATTTAEAIRKNISIIIKGREVRESDDLQALFDDDFEIDADDILTPEDLGLFGAKLSDDDPNIAEVEIEDGVVSIDYLEPAKLFGFIPFGLRTTAVGDVDADGATEVKVKFPWYHIFAKKLIPIDDIEAGIKAELEQFELTRLQTLHAQMAKMLQTISEVMKTKHDTVKNSIGNIR